MPRVRAPCWFALRDEGESAHGGAQDALFGGEHASSGHVVTTCPPKPTRTPQHRYGPAAAREPPAPAATGLEQMSVAAVLPAILVATENITVCFRACRLSRVGAPRPSP